MKLSVSNIAWESNELDGHLALLQKMGCQGLEVAPSLIWPEPIDSTKEQRRAFKNKVKGFGLQVVGLHSLLYTRPDLKLFESDQNRARTVEYLVQLCELCKDLGGKVLVFGSPKNRARDGKDYQVCKKIAVDFFTKLGQAAKKYDVIICVEALSTKESDFINSSREAFELIKKVGLPNFGLHLDAKAMIESHEDANVVFTSYAKILRHFHVGDPGLAPPGSTGMDHGALGQALNKAGYDGFVSIEMKRGFGPSRDVVRKSIEYVKKCYFN